MKRLFALCALLAGVGLSPIARAQLGQIPSWPPVAHVSSGGAFAQDNFNGTNGTLLSAHTSSFGTTWTHVTVGGTLPQTAQLQSNTLVSSDSTNLPAYYIASGTPPSADYSATMALKNFNSGVSNMIDGPSVRGVSSDINAYGCFLGDNGAGFAEYMQATGIANIGTNVLFTPSSGTTYTVTITATGSTITCAVQRDSDNKWLTSAGTWQVSQTISDTATDSNITRVGSAGVLIMGNNTNPATSNTGISFSAQ